MFEVWLQMSDTNIDRKNPSNLPALATTLLSFKLIGRSVFELESGNKNADEQTDGHKEIYLSLSFDYK